MYLIVAVRVLYLFTKGIENKLVLSYKLEIKGQFTYR